MSERAFHMTPAQAEILRGLRDWPGQEDEVDYASAVMDSDEMADCLSWGWVAIRNAEPDPIRGARVIVSLTDAGREALQRYEEGRA